MAWRTTPQAVRDLIDSDPDLNLSEFLHTATVLTDYVSSKDDEGLLNDDLLQKIEQYLAAHFYEHRDPQYTEKETGDAKAKFQGEFGKGLESSKWGQTAMMLDVTGTLRKLSQGVTKVGLEWLGYPPSEQTDYVDRD